MPQGRNKLVTEDELQRLLEQLEPTGLHETRGYSKLPP